jgi:hypothetical protein
MKTGIALFTLLFLAVLFASAKDNDAGEAFAQETANRFYQVYLKLNPRGLPTELQMRSFEPLLSRELVELISHDRSEQQKFIREHPDEKPPWIEGNLFASCYEGVSSYSLGAPTFNDGKASFPVYLTFREGKQEVRWLDVLVLERANTEWRVWDIFLNAPWPFRSGPSLRAILSGE